MPITLILILVLLVIGIYLIVALLKSVKINIKKESKKTVICPRCSSSFVVKASDVVYNESEEMKGHIKCPACRLKVDINLQKQKK